MQFFWEIIRARYKKSGLFCHIFRKQGFDGGLQYGSQAVKLDIGNGSGSVFDSGYGTAADIDRHGFQLLGQLLLTEFPFFLK